MSADREWRSNNLLKWRKQRNRSKQRRQQETRTLAVNNHSSWTREEIAYLEKYGRTQTIKEMAIKLGRSYSGVQNAAHRYGISLFSQKKASGLIHR